jgi:hypothetical protein
MFRLHPILSSSSQHYAWPYGPFFNANKDGSALVIRSSMHASCIKEPSQISDTQVRSRQAGMGLEAIRDQRARHVLVQDSPTGFAVHQTKNVGPRRPGICPWAVRQSLQVSRHAGSRFYVPARARLQTIVRRPPNMTLLTSNACHSDQGASRFHGNIKRSPDWLKLNARNAAQRVADPGRVLVCLDHLRPL